LPGFHVRTTRKLAPRSSVPILKADSAVIQGSTEIIDFLDQTFPDRTRLFVPAGLRA
jgi:glutathione S-transferase